MDQVISQLSATHIELHKARDLIEETVWEIQRMASSSDLSADESGYVTPKPPCPRAAYVTGPDPTRTIDLNIPDHPHELVLGKCPMWLPAKSSGTKSDDRSPSATQKDLKSNSTSPHCETPQVVTPRESTKEYVQLYGYFDWKDEVNESLGWLTSQGTNMKARLDFHTDLATDMSGHMNELGQDIMQNQERTTNAMRDARIARIQSRVAVAVALVVSIASMIIKLYR
ncbi:hypothetical protein L1987_54535 [Smallanthus sonchifolius]|uniref:Uncharacterized protein n=1 Tax=Smallanthus sonchifolius TaxID=185202 RepID=A0ACB9E7V2_9ASTR|nr:hypothetical protein L1987_54535 [Smallanthus sonchifolius]